MTSRIEDIFIWLLEKSTGIALITICILLVRYFLKKYPRKYSYFLWLALGIRLLWVMPIQVESPVFMELPGNYFINQISSIRNDDIDEKISFRDGEAAVEAEADLSVMPPNLTEKTTGLTEDLSVSYRQKILSVEACIWAAGVVLFLLYFIVSYVKMNHKVRFTVKFKENIYECDAVGTPFVMGILKPRIYLPFSMNEEHRKFVICHETCHIRRKDHLVKLLAFLLLGIYWFHPCVWIGYIFMCRDMEMSCDELAVGELGISSKQAYSTALLTFAAERRFVGSMLGFGEHDASKRIKNILGFHIPGKTVKIMAGVLCGILIPVLGCEVISAPSEQRKEIAASPAAQELYEAATPYIGSVPAVSNILDILRKNDIMPQDAGTLELQTDETPYGLIVHFTEIPEDEDELCNKMYNTGLLLWALVENLENVEWTFPSEEDGKEILVTYYLDRNAVNSAYGNLKNIKDYGKSPEKVEELMRMAGIAIEQIPELKNLSSGFNKNSDLEAREQAIKAGAKIEELPDKILAIAKELDVLDERYYFSLYANQNVEFGESQEKACELARGVMMNNMKIYQYAVNHGMEIPEEELKIQIENSKKLCESAVNYEEMQKKYAEVGLSFEDMDKKENEDGLLNKISYTIEWLYQIKSYEFRHGTNKIGDYECENLDNYWRYFLLQEVFPEAKTYDLSDYEKKLDEAEAYYLEHVAE